MKYRGIFVRILLCAVLLGGAAYARNAGEAKQHAGFSLQEALAVAYETNPQLAAARAGLRATDENVAQANANWRPTINASGTYGFESYRVAGTPERVGTHPLQVQVGVQENIFRGGRTYAEIRRAKAQVRAGRADLVATEQTVLLTAVTAYMDVVRDTVILGLRQQNVAVLRRQRDATLHQFKAGVLTRTDVSQSTARLSMAEADVTTAQGQLDVSRSNFLNAIGRPAETLDDLPALPAILPANLDAALAMALKLNPALLSARENELVARFSVDEARGAMLPQIAVQGGYSYSQQDYSNTIGAGSVVQGLSVIATVNVPIYQGGAEHSALRQSKELYAQAKYTVSVTDRQVRDAVTSAWSQYQAAKASIDSNRATAEADATALEGVRKEQQIGARTILDVLNAEQELLNARASVVAAQRNTMVAAFQLLAASGRLTAQALALDVKFYDPKTHYNENAASWFGHGGR